MLLAWKDIRFNLTRFILAVAGLTAIITVALGMNGLYRGIVHESLVMVQDIGADAWLVQGGREGPFDDESHVSSLLDRRAEGLPGVREARRFLYFSLSLRRGSRQIRNSIFALDFPKDKGDWLKLVAGRRLRSSHFEMMADQSTGLSLNDQIRIGRDDYMVVGITKGEVDMAGDGLFFVSLLDAQNIMNDSPSEAILLARGAEGGSLSEARKDGPIMAVVLTLDPGASAEAIRQIVRSWGDVSMISKSEQIRLVVDGRLRRLRLQILLFVALMYAISGIIVSLTIFTIVLEKLHDIALLKLLGARDRYVAGWILQYGLLMGILSFGLATLISESAFRYFPRAILLYPSDVGVAGIALIATCAVACIFSIQRAIKVRAREILS
jgi:putative ABC transport system permease protein